MRELTPKPLFASSTIRGATASAVATLIIGILPFAQNIANRHCEENQTCLEDTNDIIEIISLVVTTIGLGSAGYAVAGRASIGDLWTPRGVPGPNREDFESQVYIENDPTARILAPRPIELDFPQSELENGSDFGRSVSPDGTNSLQNTTTFDDPTEGIQ